MRKILILLITIGISIAPVFAKEKERKVIVFDFVLKNVSPNNAAGISELCRIKIRQLKNTTVPTTGVMQANWRYRRLVRHGQCATPKQAKKGMRIFRATHVLYGEMTKAGGSIIFTLSGMNKDDKEPRTVQIEFSSTSDAEDAVEGMIAKIFPEFDFFEARFQTPKEEVPLVQWERPIGGKGIEEAHAITTLQDGGYAFVGYTMKNETNSDILVTAINEEGDVRFSKTYGGTLEDVGWSIIEATPLPEFKDDPALFLVGMHERLPDAGNTARRAEVVMMFVNAKNGENIRTWNYGRTKWSEGRNATLLNNEKYAVVGITDGWYEHSLLLSSSANLLLIETNGNVNNQERRGVIGRNGFNAILATSDGGFIACGYKGAEIGNALLGHVVKYSDNGDNVEWEKTFGEIQNIVFNAVVEGPNNTYVLAGTSTFLGSDNYNGYAICLNAKGERLWEHEAGDDLLDSFNSITTTKDGGYMCAGYRDGIQTENELLGANAWVYKISAEGKAVFQNTYGGRMWDQAKHIIKTPDGGYILAGSVESKGNGETDAWVIKLKGE